MSSAESGIGPGSAVDAGGALAAHGAEEIRRHLRVYVTVFAALAALTIATVGASYMHLPVKRAIALALAIATVKASLVAAYFMHLISERKIIYWVLALTAIFFAFLMAIPVLTYLETET